MSSFSVISHRWLHRKAGMPGSGWGWGKPRNSRSNGPASGQLPEPLALNTLVACRLLSPIPVLSVPRRTARTRGPLGLRRPAAEELAWTSVCWLHLKKGRWAWTWAGTEAKERDPCQQTPARRCLCHSCSRGASRETEAGTAWKHRHPALCYPLPGANTAWRCMAGGFHSKTRKVRPFQTRSWGMEDVLWL